MATGVILVPIVLSKVGKEAYGVWAIVGSFLACMALLDAGLTVAVRRYAARYVALKSISDQSAMMSTVIVFYTVMSLVGAAVTYLAAPYVPVVMDKIPESLHADTVMLFRVASGIAFLRLFMLPFKGFIEGHLRYEATNLAAIVSRLFYFGLVILLLNVYEPSITLIGIAVVCGSSLEWLILVVFCFHLEPQLRISPRHFSRSQLKMLSGFGINAFILAICTLLIFQTPNFVNMKWLGPEATAVFSVAGMCIIMIRSMVGGVSSVFLPLFSASHAIENQDQIEDRLWKGNQVCSLLNWALCVGVIVYARPLLEQWIRKAPQVAAVAYWPFIILAVGQLPQGFARVANAALSGCGYLKWLVISQVITAVLTLGLSIAAVLAGYGLVGVAVAAVAPLFVRSVVWTPWYTCHKFKMPLVRYMKKSFLRPLLAVSLLALACLALQRVYPVNSRVSLLVSAAVLGVLGCGLGLGVGLAPEIRRRLVAPVARMIGLKGT